MVLEQEFNPKDVFPNKKKARIITAFVIDETLIQIAILMMHGFGL
jgi:hypothetical protein